MEGDIDAELLQICWTPLGFKLSERHCAAKFYAKVFFDFYQQMLSFVHTSTMWGLFIIHSFYSSNASILLGDSKDKVTIHFRKSAVQFCMN